MILKKCRKSSYCEKETGNKNMCITHALYHVDIIERCSRLGGWRKGEAHVRDRLRKTWWRWCFLRGDLKIREGPSRQRWGRKKPLQMKAKAERLASMGLLWGHDMFSKASPYDIGATCHHGGGKWSSGKVTNLGKFTQLSGRVGIWTATCLLDHL